MEDKNEKINILLIILIVLIVLLLIGLIGYKIISNNPKKNNLENEKNNIINEEKNNIINGEKKNVEDSFVNLDIEDDSLLDMFEAVHYKKWLIPDEQIFNNQKLTVEDMDESYKLGLASNLFLQYEQKDSTGYGTIKENDVRLAYEKIFGPNTYKRVDQIDLNCPVYKFNPDTNSYEGNTNCEKIPTYYSREVVTAIKKYNDRMEFISVVVFEDMNYNLYRDFDRTQYIKTLTYEESSNVDSKEIYIRQIQDSLQEYKYTFLLNEDGFYYYSGVERTKE